MPVEVNLTGTAAQKYTKDLCNKT